MIVYFRIKNPRLVNNDYASTLKTRKIVSAQNEIELNNQTLYSEDNPPPSFVEASARRTILTNKVNSIDLQIQIRDAEYKQWRDKAVIAKAFAAREISYIKGWVREKSDVVMLSETEIIATDPESLLREAYRTLRRIDEGDGKLVGTDHVLISAMERHVLK